MYKERIVTVDVEKRKDSIKETRDTIIGDIENAIDQILVEGKTDFILSEYLSKNSIKPIYTNYIVEYYLPIYEDFKNNQKESSLSKSGKQTLLKFYESILNESGTWKQTKSANRKSRVKKSASTEKIVARVQYQKENTELGVAGLEPGAVLNKDVCLAFNSKTRKLMVFHKSDNTLSLKGTTLCNVDDKKSFEKTLRKPKEQIAQLLGLTKAKQLKFIESINSKKQIPSTRLNNNVLILKTY